MLSPVAVATPERFIPSLRAQRRQELEQIEQEQQADYRFFPDLTHNPDDYFLEAVNIILRETETLEPETQEFLLYEISRTKAEGEKLHIEDTPAVVEHPNVVTVDSCYTMNERLRFTFRYAAEADGPEAVEARRQFILHMYNEGLHEFAIRMAKAWGFRDEALRMFDRSILHMRLQQAPEEMIASATAEKTKLMIAYGNAELFTKQARESRSIEIVLGVVRFLHKNGMNAEAFELLRGLFVHMQEYHEGPKGETKPVSAASAINAYILAGRCLENYGKVNRPEYIYA